MAGWTEWLPLSVESVCGQIGDCVTTAGRRPQALGFALGSVNVYIAQTLILRGGTNTSQSNEKVPGYIACSGVTDECCSAE